MSSENNLKTARRAFAEELRATAPVLRHERVVDAFAVVPRERFMGPGPWKILPGTRFHESYMTSDADPRRLYHDVLVPLDETQDINNGQPSLWAFMFDRLDVRPGERVLQVGAGTGYYTAILAELVGRDGHVTAVEYDDELAARAANNVSLWPQVELRHGDGATVDPGEVDVVVAFAGVTHPAPHWLNRLAQGGRLMVGLTATGLVGFHADGDPERRQFSCRGLGSYGFRPVCRTRRGSRCAARQDTQTSQGQTHPDCFAAPRFAAGRRRKRRLVLGPGFWLSRQ